MMQSLRSALILSLVMIVVLIETSHIVWAGGMFHGVRCGEGQTTTEAIKILNERIHRGSYAGSVHSGLTLISKNSRVLACVLVNREGHVLTPPGYKTQAKCLTRPWNALARSNFGFYFQDRSGWLTDLTLSLTSSGKVTACALGHPRIKR